MRWIASSLTLLAMTELLSVAPAGLADALQRFGGAILVGFAAEVAEADDPAQAFLVVDHRQAADLGIAHLARDIVDVIVLAGADDVVGHQLADGRVGAIAFGDSAHRDVAVG